MKLIKMLNTNTFKYDDGTVLDFTVFNSQKKRRKTHPDANGCIFDGDHLSSINHEGRMVVHPIYQIWYSMKQRCYNGKLHEKYPNYVDCKMSDEWKIYSKFAKWVISQDEWIGLCLDKDILVKDNKLYSADTCRFVPGYINNLLLSKDNDRGLFPLGVTISQDGQIASRCSDGKGKQLTSYFGSHHIGMNRKETRAALTAIRLAHHRWQEKKAGVIRSQVLKYEDEGNANQDVSYALLLRADSLDSDRDLGLETTSI